jgi:hypothetical protein
MRVTPAAWLIAGLVVAATGGLLFSGWAFTRWVDLTRVEPGAAASAFEAARAPWQGRPPLVSFEENGAMVRHEGERNPPGRPRVLRALLYQPTEQRLVRAEVPMWFLKMKGPAARYALRGTGLDLDALGLTPADLERHGPGLVLDHVGPSGEPLLVWTE